MVRALWNGTVLAESDTTVVVEGNHYFPPGSLKHDHLMASATTSVCGWKGTAHYYDVVVGNDVNKDAAWYYPAPSDKAGEIQDHVAFWKGVKVES